MSGTAMVLLRLPSTIPAQMNGVQFCLVRWPHEHEMERIMYFHSIFTKQMYDILLKLKLFGTEKKYNDKTTKEPYDAECLELLAINPAQLIAEYEQVISMTYEEHKSMIDQKKSKEEYKLKAKLDLWEKGIKLKEELDKIVSQVDDIYFEKSLGLHANNNLFGIPDDFDDDY